MKHAPSLIDAGRSVEIADCATMGEVGPNAISQLVAVIGDARLKQQAKAAFESVHARHWLDHPPSQKVDARLAGEVFRAVHAHLPSAEAEAVMREAGDRTADYLLRHRIPRFFQALLAALPPGVAARALTALLQRNARSFAGTARFTVLSHAPLVVDIRPNPLCGAEHVMTGGCAWHVAVFQRLYRALVSPATRVREMACMASGAPSCRFLIDWRATGQISGTPYNARYSARQDSVS